MAFIVYGPGVRDPISLRTPETRSVSQPNETEAIRPVPGSEEEKSSGHDEQANAGRQQRVSVYQRTQDQKAEEVAQYAYQIMSSPVYTVNFNDSIEELLHLFRDKRFRHVPVIDDEHKIVGIISDRDVMRYIAGIDDQEEDEPSLSREEKRAQSIKSLVKTRVMTASLDTQVRQIARVLFEQRIGAMPIVNDSGMLHGIITRGDILKALVKNSALELWA